MALEHFGQRHSGLVAGQACCPCGDSTRRRCQVVAEPGWYTSELRHQHPLGQLLLAQVRGSSNCCCALGFVLLLVARLPLPWFSRGKKGSVAQRPWVQGVVGQRCLGESARARSQDAEVNTASMLQLKLEWVLEPPFLIWQVKRFGRCSDHVNPLDGRPLDRRVP